MSCARIKERHTTLTVVQGMSWCAHPLAAQCELVYAVMRDVFSHPLVQGSRDPFDLSLLALDTRRLPRPVNDFLFRPVEPHNEIESFPGSRKPVGLLVFPGGSILHMKGQGAVAVELDPVAIPNGVAVDRVGHEELPVVVQGNGP